MSNFLSQQHHYAIEIHNLVDLYLLLLCHALCCRFSVFQHYKMYEFMFSTTQAEEIIGTDVSSTISLLLQFMFYCRDRYLVPQSHL